MSRGDGCRVRGCHLPPHHSSGNTREIMYKCKRRLTDREEAEEEEAEEGERANWRGR